MQILLSLVLMLMSSEFTSICIAEVFYNGFTLKIKGQNIIPEHFWVTVLKKYRSLQCRHDSINQSLQTTEGIEGKSEQQLVRSQRALIDPKLLYKFRVKFREDMWM